MTVEPTDDFWSDTTPIVTKIDNFWAATADRDPIHDSLEHMIKQRYKNTPRHLQKALGPSEVGHPCMRKMAMGMMEVERSNPEWDPLPSIIGTATHTWLDGAAQLANDKLGRVRWLTETRVEVAPGLSGSCDLYDLDTGTVIDWKCLGYTSFTAQIKDISPTYRNQVQLYGKGFRNMGLPVNKVAIALLPRAGMLAKMHLHIEDYDESIVAEVLSRRNTVIELLDTFQVEANPERYQWIPATPYQCLFCPFYRPNPTGPLQCKGVVDA